MHLHLPSRLLHFDHEANSHPGPATTTGNEAHQAEAGKQHRVGLGFRYGRGRSAGGHVHRPGIARLGVADIGNEDITEIIRNGQIGNRRVGHREYKIAGDGKIPVAASGTGDPEQEIPGPVSH